MKTITVIQEGRGKAVIVQNVANETSDSNKFTEEVLFSYGVCVAVAVWTEAGGMKYGLLKATDKKYSQTTTRHINKFINDRSFCKTTRSEEQLQDYLDNHLLQLSSKEEDHVSVPLKNVLPPQPVETDITSLHL